MEITEVKICKYFNKGPVLATASIIFDRQLAVHDIQVIDNGKRIFVSMPQRLEKNMWRDIVHLIDTDFREKLEDLILGKFYEYLDQPDQEPVVVDEVNTDKTTPYTVDPLGQENAPIPMLTDREVDVMLIIWESSSLPVSTSEIYHAINLAERNSLQTLQVVLRRLCNKGALVCEKGKQMNYYRALVRKVDYMRFATDNFLEHHFHGSLRLYLSMMVKNKKLTNKDLEDICGFISTKKADVLRQASVE